MGKHNVATHEWGPSARGVGDHTILVVDTSIGIWPGKITGPRLAGDYGVVS